jgi:vitellogenic carboxypeptidase-like protein
MYSGTLPANSLPNTNHNLFYWLFKSKQARPDAPLVLWLNGGPGSSSMFGLFAENGPLRVSRNGTGTGDFQVHLPRDGQGSWLDEGVDIVFVDQPVGTGFSFGDSLATTMQ